MHEMSGSSQSRLPIGPRVGCACSFQCRASPFAALVCFSPLLPLLSRHLETRASLSGQITECITDLPSTILTDASHKHWPSRGRLPIPRPARGYQGIRRSCLKGQSTCRSPGLPGLRQARHLKSLTTNGRHMCRCQTNKLPLASSLLIVIPRQVRHKTFLGHSSAR